MFAEGMYFHKIFICSLLVCYARCSLYIMFFFFVWFVVRAGFEKYLKKNKRNIWCDNNVYRKIYWLIYIQFASSCFFFGREGNCFLFLCACPCVSSVDLNRANAGVWLCPRIFHRKSNKMKCMNLGLQQLIIWNGDIFLSSPVRLELANYMRLFSLHRHMSTSFRIPYRLLSICLCSDPTTGHSHRQPSIHIIIYIKKTKNTTHKHWSMAWNVHCPFFPSHYFPLPLHSPLTHKIYKSNKKKQTNNSNYIRGANGVSCFLHCPFCLYF